MTGPGAGPLFGAGTFFLEDDHGPAGGARLFLDPVDAIEAWSPEAVPAALHKIEEARNRGLHAAGFIAYELGYLLEPRLRPHWPGPQDTPLLAFGLYGAPARLEPGAVEAWLAETAADAAADVALEATWAWGEYRAAFDMVQELIRAGDAYQVNLTFPLAGRSRGDPAALYRRLRRRARARHGALLKLADRHILSLSPELFLETDGTQARTRPMKGTAPRAPDAARDRVAAAALAQDAKSRAENLMIVDLLRNDLGRLARPGSVSVERLFDVETYPTLHQMTSTISAHLRPGTGVAELLEALFPCGSVTGAPKIRAMEIIRALERHPRGVYCGAIGVVEPSGACRLNVAIRTLSIFADGRAVMGVGSGLVADSQGRAEYDECLLKARFLAPETPPFALFETLLWRADTGYGRLSLHLDRLEASARYFGFPLSRAAAEARLHAAARGFGGATQRVRLTLSEEGALAVVAEPFDPPDADALLHVIVAAARVSSEDPFLFHKTTRRAFYDETARRLKDRHGADEVIFLNERGELAEGSRTNLFLARGGCLRTPALASGLLPGTLRRHLIETGQCVEAVLTYEDLLSADRVYLGNALRGLQPALVMGREEDVGAG